MMVPEEKVTPEEADAAVGELKDMWGPIYNPINGSRDHCRSQADGKWEVLQPEHLTLTLKVIRGHGLDPTPHSSDDPAIGYCNRDHMEEKALILMVGFSVEQLALCMAFHYLEYRCRKFVTFYSEQSGNDFFGKYQELLGGLIGKDPGEVGRTVEVIRGTWGIVNPNRPSDVFKKVAEWLRHRGGDQRYVPLKRFALDVTGGQKPMDSGASAAAAFFNIPAFYLDFTDYDDLLRRPKPYSLRYRRLLLPSTAFSHHNRRDLREAIRAPSSTGQSCCSRASKTRSSGIRVTRTRRRSKSLPGS